MRASLVSLHCALAARFACTLTACALIACSVFACTLSACTKGEPTVSEPGAAVGEDQLAAAGYFGSAKTKAAWDRRRAQGVAYLDGSELVGKPAPRWFLTNWVNGEPLKLAALHGRVVVVRFWTSPGCPFCEKTLPALERLSGEYAGEPVTFVGAYHSKPASAVTDMKVPAQTAADWKVDFALALDPEWKTLKSWWLATGERSATSVTFVIGKDGTFRFIHPGPVFHPSSDPSEAKQNSDFFAVNNAIRAALAD